MEFILKNKILVAGLALFLTLLIAVLDFSLPLGIIIWIFYLIPAALIHLAFKKHYSLIFIGVCAVLMFSSIKFSPPGIPVVYALFNRVMGIVVFLFLHFLLSHLQNAQRKIDEINRRFKIAVKSASTGVWELNIGTRRVFWDESMFRLYKKGEADFLNDLDCWKMFIIPEDVDRVADKFSESLAGQGDYHDKYKIIRGDGEVRFISSFGEIQRDSQGKPYKVVGVNIDQTVHNQAEMQLQLLNEELTSSNKELENFAYVASHDLQEPLRMISSFTKLLEKKYYDKLDQEAHEYIKFVVDGANHMQNLINDLLEYSRITTQQGILKEIDLNTIVTRALDNLQMKITDCDAEVVVGDLPVICGDELHLVRLFQNLVDNGLKFSRQNGVSKIEINCKPDFNAWLVSVSDNGIGIDEKNLDKIFEIFQRLNPRDKYPGTGIGLAICKKIVEQHGGRIWLESKVGEGTTFYFTIKK